MRGGRKQKSVAAKLVLIVSLLVVFIVSSGMRDVSAERSSGAAGGGGCTKAPSAYDQGARSSYRMEEERRAAEAAAFERFRQEAAAWRALPVKPPLPEEARRNKVLAEDALQGKNFEDALGYYEKGLSVASLWPDGQFNAALLCGELKKYPGAVGHMKRYLELAPDAPDAPAGRDKLIIWEEKARKMAVESAAEEEAMPAKPSKKMRSK